MLLLYFQGCSTDVVLLDNFDDYWRVASKVTPMSGPHRSQSPGPLPSSTSMHTRPPSAEPSGMSDREGAYNVRNVPVRLYLPDGPVLQGLVPPMLEDGKPCLKSLHAHACEV